MQVRTAVIPVAGLGTRFLPITKVVAKELLPLIDTPVIFHIVKEAIDAGIENIIFITSRGKFSVEDYFDFDIEDHRYAHKKSKLLKEYDYLRSVKYLSVRQHRALGLGHAILCAKPIVQNEPFAVLLGDDLIDAPVPCTKQLIDVFHEKNSDAVVGVMEVPEQDTNKYGIVAGESESAKLMRVKTVVEKPLPQQAPSRLAIPGRYVFSAKIFDHLEHTQPSVGGEIQLTDAIMKLAQIDPVYAYVFDGRRFDAGNQIGYLEANIHYGLKRKELREPILSLLGSILKENQ